MQQFHSEAGAGQWEFVLPPAAPLAAIDTLYQARQIIAQIAETRGLRATLHPSPFSGVSTAAHAHVSLSTPGAAGVEVPPENVESGFWAGVLHHLSAICAFTLPERDSYKRVADNSWTGGTYVAWGTQNRETPLRRIGDGRWEVRVIDGFANMFLAMSAVMGAGLLGLRKGWGVKELGKDCDCECFCSHRDIVLNYGLRSLANYYCLVNPAKVSDDKKLEYGVVRRLPQTPESAFSNLEMDVSLMGILPSGLAHDYLVMKREEQKMLQGMSEAGRRIWLIERY